MAELNVYDRNGKMVDKYTIDLAELAPRINKQLLHDAAVMYQANVRMGTSKTKARGEVSGSTKKLHRQKGTGNSRVGSRHSGIRRGGGHIHALRPREYSYRLTRKALQLATRMAIASKIRDDEMVVIDQLAFDEPRTKEMASILAALGLQGTSTLVATEKHDVNIYKSARNIVRVMTASVAELNALSVLKPRKMLVTKAALDEIKNGASLAKVAPEVADAGGSEAVG